MSWVPRVRVLAGPALVLATLAGIPAGLRLLHLNESGIGWSLPDRWGVISDIAVGAAVGIATLLLASRSRLSGRVLGLFWIALCFGWYEFQRQYGSPLFLVHSLYMLDPTFLSGSAAGLAHPLLVVLSVGLLATGLWFVRTPVGLRPTLALAATAAGLVAGQTFLPNEWGAPVWRERNFLLPNLADAAGRAMAGPGLTQAHAEQDPDVDALYAADLAGTPRFTFPDTPRNVLLVMIEGVPGGALPWLAERHGVTSDVRFDGLDRLARDNLSFSTFVTHQRQTNRGEYAALCGDFPKLATAMAKMTEIANGIAKRCLPQVLRENGYATLYMQSANLTFMYKDLFMRKAGFDISYGEDWFDPKYPWGGWGVDDAALYESSIPEIEKLDRAGKPWFVTLLTSGTHHPYHIPESYTDFPDASREVRAMQFADVAATRFVAELRSRGLLEDTLVLITSDEASFVQESPPRKPEVLGKLTANWGFLIALLPEATEATRIDEPVQQADLTVSILDYLGMGSSATDFIGRSLFRHYDSPRRIPFANLYDRMTGEYREDGSMTICQEDLSGCTGYTVPDGRIFSADVAETGAAEPSMVLRGAQARSMRPALPAPRTGSGS